jgi:hypothetical protein
MVTKQSVYHGTNFEFDCFDSKKLGVSCDNPTTMMGFFFSSSKEGAYRWAHRSSTWGTLQGTTVSNPMVVIADVSELQFKKMSAEKFTYYLKTARQETIFRHVNKWKSNGYDGLHIKLVDEDWFCVFESGKIKIVGREHQPAVVKEEHAPFAPGNPPQEFKFPRIPYIPRLQP